MANCNALASITSIDIDEVLIILSIVLLPRFSMSCLSLWDDPHEHQFHEEFKNLHERQDRHSHTDAANTSNIGQALRKLEQNYNKYFQYQLGTSKTRTEF